MTSTVTALLRERAPHLADLTVSPSPSQGSSNHVFRLGDDLAVRLPRSETYADDMRREIRWVPPLVPALSGRVPRLVVAGEASDVFGHPWSVVTWIEGTTPAGLGGAAQTRLARQLGSFLTRMHDVSVAGIARGPGSWGYRCGEPVTDEIDDWVDRSASALDDLLDPAAVREAWARLREVPPATAPACWVHTDISSENLLVRHDGSLAGVIDFGGIGVGDPSIDLLYAWSLFDPPAHAVCSSVPPRPTRPHGTEREPGRSPGRGWSRSPTTVT